jgi:hypothetical protein
LIEKSLAAVALAVCAVLLVRLLLGARRRHRFDASVTRAWHAGIRWVRGLRRQRVARQNAQRLADEVIRRARDGVPREGNVYRPKSFRRPRKPH